MGVGQCGTIHHFADMADRMQAVGFQQAEQQVVAGHVAITFVQAAQLHATLAREGHSAARIRITAQHVEIEIGFEDRTLECAVALRVFIEVDRTKVRLRCHALGK